MKKYNLFLSLESTLYSNKVVIIVAIILKHKEKTPSSIHVLINEFGVSFNIHFI